MDPFFSVRGASQLGLVQYIHCARTDSILMHRCQEKQSQLCFSWHREEYSLGYPVGLSQTIAGASTPARVLHKDASFEEFANIPEGRII